MCLWTQYAMDVKLAEIYVGHISIGGGICRSSCRSTSWAVKGHKETWFSGWKWIECQKHYRCIDGELSTYRWKHSYHWSHGMSKPWPHFAAIVYPVTVKILSTIYLHSRLLVHKSAEFCFGKSPHRSPFPKTIDWRCPVHKDFPGVSQMWVLMSQYRNNSTCVFWWVQF